MVKQAFKTPSRARHACPLIIVSTLIFLFLTLACDFEISDAIKEGNIAFDNGQYTEALNAYAKVRSESEHMPEATYNSANVYYRNGDYLSARKGYEEALLNAKERLAQDGLFNLGNTLYRLENLELAIESYKELLRTNHQDMDSKFNLEIALLHLQQFEAEQDQQNENSPDSQQNTANANSPNPSDSPLGAEPPGNASDEPFDEQETDQPSTEELTSRQSDGLDMEPKTELSEEQARQILEMIGNQTDTLQSHLGNKLEVAGNPPIRDW